MRKNRKLESFLFFCADIGVEGRQVIGQTLFHGDWVPLFLHGIQGNGSPGGFVPIVIQKRQWNQVKVSRDLEVTNDKGPPALFLKGVHVHDLMLVDIFQRQVFLIGFLDVEAKSESLAHADIIHG